ncbi:MAG: hypothetical protein NZ802_04800 [Candidatus Poseidoniales archaeon]|nr:hypothetical protein [Candidatus Poseidoniales archaeon]
MGEAPKKKRGLLRRSVGAVGRGSAKVIGTTAKVTAKGTGKVAKATVKATAKGTGKVAKVTAKGAGKATVATAKGAGKGSLFLARGAGRAAVRGARKAFPREEGESAKEYRIRMAKLGFKVSLWTGTIVATTYGSVQAQKIALAFKAYELYKGTDSVTKFIQEHLDEVPVPEPANSIVSGMMKLGFVLLVTLTIIIMISFVTT